MHNQRYHHRTEQYNSEKPQTDNQQDNAQNLVQDLRPYNAQFRGDAAPFAGSSHLTAQM
jgi:hypothetical protein